MTNTKGSKSKYIHLIVMLVLAFAIGALPPFGQSAFRRLHAHPSFGIAQEEAGQVEGYGLVRRVRRAASLRARAREHA